MKPQQLSSNFNHYPHLTPAEFTEAAHHLDRRYCQATLGPVRRQWKLRMCTALNTTAAYTLGPEYCTYLQIVRPLEEELDDAGLAGVLDGFSFGDVQEEVGGGDRDMVEAEEGDQVGDILWSVLLLVKSYSVQTKAVLLGNNNNKLDPFGGGRGHVRYEIHLHPTYQAPCLWFSLHDLPADEQALNIDTVFRRLVPEQFKPGLRASLGSIGGISVDVRSLFFSLF